MIYPGYLLNPGDMFQVEPDRVMFATGKPKEPGPGKVTKAAAASEDTEVEADTTASEKVEAEAVTDELEDTEVDEDPRKALKSLLAQAKSLLSKVPEKVPGKRKQDVRAFQRAVQRTLSRSQTSTILTDSLEAQFLELKTLLKVPDKLSEKGSDEPTKQEAEGKETTEVDSNPNTSSDHSDSTQVSKTSPDKTTFDMKSLTDSDIRAIHRAMELLRDNPLDPSKPYATPWSPRDYMSAFAFIPRYLEVNQNICAAVYLRHPVARPGLAEVPSPYGEGTQGEAFAWYLRRR